MGDNTIKEKVQKQNSKDESKETDQYLASFAPRIPRKGSISDAKSGSKFGWNSKKKGSKKYSF